MTDRGNISKKTVVRRLSPVQRMGIIILTGVFLLSATLLLVRRIDYGVWAGDMLREAKLVRLATDSVSKSFFATGKTFYDSSSFYGVTAEAREEIVNLSGCEGVFSVLAVDGDSRSVTGLFYSNYGYAAVFTAGLNEPWVLFKEE